MTILATAAVLAGFGLVRVTNHAGAVLTGELTLHPGADRRP